jgi:hypothetical protein
MSTQILGKVLIIGVSVVLCFNIALSEIAADTTKEIRIKPKSYYKSPGLAMVLSSIIPGGGQFYTENYLKGILFVGTEGTLAYFAYQDHIDYQNTRDVKFKNSRNNLLWWIATVKLISIADAYISANMYKFKDQMKLTFDYQPKQQKFSFGLLCNLTPHPLSLYPKF